MQQQPETQELRHSWAGRPDEGGEDEIDLVELMYRLLEKWKIIVLACILGALIAGVYTICFVTPMYTATSKAVRGQCQRFCDQPFGFAGRQLSGQRLYRGFFQLARA